MVEGEFTFTLTGENIDGTETQTNGEGGIVTFNTLYFAVNPTDEQANYIDVTNKLDENGEYKFELTVGEDTSDLASKHITLQGEATRKVTVTVKQDENGNLSASATPGIAGLTFTND